jgi:predicted transcriptional regulator
LNSQPFSIDFADICAGRMRMRKSRLETYEAIMEALVKEPLTNDQIAYEACVECKALCNHLDFLIQNGLVEDRENGSETVYALTERGMTVLKTLSFSKYLAKVTESLRALDDATRALPLMSNEAKESEKEDEHESY